MYYQLIQSPAGLILAAADDDALLALKFINPPADAIDYGWSEAPNHPILNKTKQQLMSYFAGKLNKFKLPIRFKGSNFQQAVWQELLKITFGQLSNYQEIAHQVGRPKAVRAVGTAIGRNPIEIIVPCHRVIASNGSLGGYAPGPTYKKALLALEDHQF